MIGELDHARNPHKAKRFWIVFYVSLSVLLLGMFWIAASKIRTYIVPSGAIQLNIPYKAYAVGEPITFTLKNSYNSAIYIANNCPAEPLAVYRYENGTWVRQHQTTDPSNCHDAERQIKVDAGAEQSGSYANWPRLFVQPGKYRVVAYVEYFDVAPYQDFEVIARTAGAPNATNTSSAAPATTTTSVPSTQASTYTFPTTSASTSAALPTSSLKSKTVTVSSGSIGVEYSSTTIYVRSIAPITGCTYEGGRSGPEVEVTFKCSHSETQVKLRLSGGQLVAKVENED